MEEIQLDVDSPFPAPQPMNEASKPQRVGYQNHDIKYGHYGQYGHYGKAEQ